MIAFRGALTLRDLQKMTIPEVLSWGKEAERIAKKIENEST